MTCARFTQMAQYLALFSYVSKKKTSLSTGAEDCIMRSDKRPVDFAMSMIVCWPYLKCLKPTPECCILTLMLTMEMEWRKPSLLQTEFLLVPFINTKTSSQGQATSMTLEQMREFTIVSIFHLTKE